MARRLLPLLALFFAAAAFAADDSQRARLVPLAAMTQDVEVLYGDPEAVGKPFVMRIRELAGGVIPPHKHPVDEHITVVQGSIWFAVSDKCERSEMRELKTGSYAFIPKGSTMCGYTPEAAIVQVHGVGPFHIHWRAGDKFQQGLRTLDSEDAARVFKFRKGERVTTARGSGRIRQGYDSGEVVAYEIDGDDGSLFMAEERDAERPRYLLYQHGRIVQTQQSRRPQHEQHGYYELDQIAETFRKQGFIVTADVRPKDATVDTGANEVVREVKELLSQGVPPQHITVVGASMGASITMRAAARLGNRDVRFAALGPCFSQSVANILGEENRYPRGQMLVVREESDVPSSTCPPYTDKREGLYVRELVINTGTAHGFLYKPMPEWVGPVSEWARATPQSAR